MKNTIKTFALFLTAGAMLASCDSYLDRQPDEPLTSDNIFKKQKTTLQYLTNIYSYQPDYEAPACVSNSNDIPWEACSDETSFAYLDRSYTQINYNSWNPSLHIYRDDTYNTPYKGIREANYFMQNVHKCPPEELNDVDKGYYYNEARFLRAHFYAMMLPVYGPVFLIGDDPVDFTQSGLDQRERNTWDECVNYVANELWEAAKGLPDSWTSTTAVPRKAPPWQHAPACCSTRPASSSTATNSTRVSSTKTATTCSRPSTTKRNGSWQPRPPKTL